MVAKDAKKLAEENKSKYDQKNRKQAIQELKSIRNRIKKIAKKGGFEYFIFLLLGSY